MRRTVITLLLLPLVALLGGDNGSAATRVVGAVPVKTGLQFPAGFTFSSAGLIFYGERLTGRIRRLNPNTGNDRVLYTVTKLSTQGEQGLLGIALDPGFPDHPFLYAYATRGVGGSLKNQILRIRVQGSSSSLDKVIFTSTTTAGQYHDGGHIAFGPDGKLYAVVGEAHDASNAQDLNTTAGKVLRMNRQGKAPAGNPFAGKLIWSYGLRNSFGFTFDPQTGRLWETEAGPSCNDEINLISEGRNYGWGPSETCSTPPAAPANTNQDGPSPVLPLAFFTPTITPVGVAFCDGCGLTGSAGHLFFGDNNNGDVHEVVLNGSRDDIASMSVVYHDSAGILSMERGPGGAIYFSDPSGIFKLVNA